MKLHQALLQLGLTQAALATPTTSLYNRNTNTSGIQWGACGFEGTLPIECSTLSVPLDYTEPDSDKTLNLSLIKVAAQKTPSKGSILFNFGGPGYEAVHTMAKLAEALQVMSGGEHDLIAFDPRGTGETIPYSCYDSPADRELATYKNPITLSDFTDNAYGALWANAKVMANTCGETTNDTGSLIGTSFVARDMMQIVDALDEDGLLRFWGFSYGTVLGAVAAAMFPDRIDRMVLDGVVNSHRYFHGYGIDTNQLLAADDAFRAILADCIEAGDRCALSQVNSTAIELETTLRLLAEDFLRAPLAVNDTVIDYELVFTLYFLVIKYPTDVPNAASLINNLLHRENLTAVTEYYKTLNAGIAVGGEGLQGIKCSDAFPRTDDMADVMPEIEYMKETSNLFWPTTVSYPMLCAQWPFEAKERYSGDFNVKTRTPLLFIGNTYDPATPAASARNMSASFEGSGMLERNGYGHASIAQASECTNKVLQAYFADATLPEEGTICEVDTALFP